MEILCAAIRIYLLVVVLRIIIGMVVEFGQITAGHPVRAISDLLGKVVDPVLAPIRRVVPALPLGNVHLDLSPLILLIGLSLLSGILCP